MARRSMDNAGEKGRGETLYFRGTFVPVEFLWKFLAEGENMAGFLAAFPPVTQEQVLSVLQAAEPTLTEAFTHHECSVR